jgi:hypothetical protein
VVDSSQFATVHPIPVLRFFRDRMRTSCI